MSAERYYDDSYERFPVEYGVPWVESKTNSVIQVYDFTVDPVPSFMTRADLLYVDPPYNMSHVTGFAHKAGNEPTTDSMDRFLNCLFAAAGVIAPSVFYCEMGKRHAPRVIERMEQAFPYVEEWPITYNGKVEARLIRGGTSPVPDSARSFSGVDDKDTPGLAIEIERPACVGDLCLGRGLTAVHAFKRGIPFVGTELARRRLAVTARKIAELGGSWNR